VTYTVDLKPAAARDLGKLPKDVRRRVAVRIDALETDPTPSGVEAIQGESDLFRLRVGDYRVLYRIDRQRREVLIARIGHRREIYRKAR
jgi:mRNA interferase RelE/StbE